MAEAVILLTVKKIGVALGNEAINQATSYFKKSVTQLTELQGSMGRIRRELRLMHEFFSGMDVRNRNNRKYEIWVEEVRMLVYQIEDIVDNYLHLVGHKHHIGWGTYLKKGFRRPNVLLSLNKIASLVKDVEASLVHLFQAKERWVFMDVGAATGGESSSYIVVEKSRHLASISRSLDEEDLVGVDENKKKLHEWLSSNELQRDVIVVHGMGDEKKSIRGNISDMDTGGLQDELKKFLKDQKYLIVLDDVWVPEAVNDLFGALVSNLSRSRVLVTTRIDGVAHLAFPDKRITLKPLSEQESWELFCRTAFPRDKDNECPAELMTLAKQIVSKCQGIPLAIVSVGRVLFVCEKTEEEFKRIHNQLDWELVNNPSLEHVRNILYLSYIYLPTHLKSCFLYCSLFPEDYLFTRKRLVRWWIAEGFVEKRGISTMEEVAEGYIKELVYRNMLQLVQKNSFGRMKSFRMHDILHELAVDLCRRECFGHSYNSKNKHEEFLEKDERRMVIHKLDKDVNQAISSEWSRLRSFVTLERNMSSPNLLTLVAGKCRYMSVLELIGLPKDNIPNVIGDLFNLKHLSLRDSMVKFLPNSIEKLSNLMTLDLCKSEIQELPGGIVKLKKLRHLFAEKLNGKFWRDFQWSTGVRIHRGLEMLSELQTLQALEVQDERSVRSLRELRQMRSIRILGVKGRYFEDLCESLCQMEYLSLLNIAASDEEEVLQLNGLKWLHPNVKKLRLIGRLAQTGLLSCAPEAGSHSLCSLCLFWSQLAEDPLPSLSRWSNLTDFRLTRAYLVEHVVFLPGWFPRLKTLYLVDMPNLKRLKIHQGSITSLEELHLINLRGMTEVPSDIIFLLPTLKYLYFLEITWDFFMALRRSRIGSIRWRYSLASDARL
ncbi:hypothetical protein OsJ_34817 [Oryza sativa Japonica Group]|uniref:Uncharacterized protein n=1 Tax=Oryza sativa subsp. japonica TaxID=39947 RepID=B9G8U4_ORYSJ|nr:hypothetical protein OsJ_34817 [Oryza sativa Japonica Group]